MVACRGWRSDINSTNLRYTPKGERYTFGAICTAVREKRSFAYAQDDGKGEFFAKLNSTVILREQSDRRISLNKHNLHNKKQYDTINVYYEIVVKV